MMGWDLHFDDEADELDVVLPGAAGREGRAVLIDDQPEKEFYVRVDVETGKPLGLVIPNWSRWHAEEQARS